MIVSIALLHLTLFALAPRIAQANPDAGRGLFVSASFGPLLEGRGSNPLLITGDAWSVEAGALLPGGSVFLWELGLRGIAVSPKPEPSRLMLHGFGAFAGVRIDVLRDPGWLGLMPSARGGLGALYVRDRLRHRPNAKGTRLDAIITAEDHLTFGPHFALGVERELFFGTAIALAVTSSFTIAPVTAHLGLTLSLIAQE